MPIGCRFAGLLTFPLVLLLSIVCSAQQPKSFEGTSDARSRQQATADIPLQQLTPAAAQKIRSVIDHPTIFRRMPTQRLDCDPDMFVFLVRYPEVLVNLWDIMGVTKVKVDRIAPYQFKCDDGAGTLCEGELIYGTENLHIYYGEGTYQGTMFQRDLAGRSVCVIHSRSVQTASGLMGIDGHMDVFIKVDNLGIDLLTRTISPFIVRTADYNFIESTKFVVQLSDVARRNPFAIEQLANRMERIDPSVRSEFVRVAYRAAERAAPTTQVSSATEVVDQSELPPIESAIEVLKSSMSSRASVKPVKVNSSLRR